MANLFVQQKTNQYYFSNTYYNKMASIVNNFRIHEPICTLHSQTCQYALLQSCRIRLICYRCLTFHKNSSSSTNSTIMSLTQFQNFIQQTVRVHEKRLREQSYLDIGRMIAERKKQFQHKLYRVFENTIKKLNQDKQKLFLELDQIARVYSLQESKYKNNVEQRDQMINYLKEFCADQTLFKLKVMASSQYGLNSWLAQVRGLQVLVDQFSARNPNEIAKDIEKQMRLKQECSLLWRVDSTLKSCREQDRLTAVLTPLNLPQKQQNFYNNQITERRNQSQQNIQVRTPRTSRQQSFAQLPKLIFN